MARIFIRNCRRLFLSQHATYHSSPPVIKYCDINEKYAKDSDMDYPSNVYNNTKSLYAIGKESAANQLQQLFDIQSHTAFDIATRHKGLCLVTCKTILANHALLQSEGVSDIIMLDHPDLLAQTDLAVRLQILKQLPQDVADTAPLLTFPILKLSKLVKKLSLEGGNRLKRFAELLQVPVGTVTKYIIQRPFLQNISMGKVEENIKLLTDFGITTDEIQSDLWVLQYSTESMAHRLAMARQLNISKLKTWMVRSQADIFNAHVQRICEKRHILGENSIYQYLSKRLECPEEQIKLILINHPAILNRCLKKINEIVDYLINDGFTLTHITRNPKILLHGLETTKKRLKELESLGVKVDSLQILTKSRKQYMNYYDSLVKSNVKPKKVKNTE